MMSNNDLAAVFIPSKGSIKPNKQPKLPPELGMQVLPECTMDPCLSIKER